MISEIYKKTCSQELRMRSECDACDTMRLTTPVSLKSKKIFRIHEQVYTPKSLAQFCTDCLCRNFQRHPFDLSQLPRNQHLILLDTLSSDIDAEITSLYVQEDHYWERCCKDHHVPGLVNLNSTWKRRYLETELTKRLEEPNPDIQALRHFMSVVNPYVRHLQFTTNPSHVSFDVILGQLSQLESIDISYGQRGRVYNPDIVGMTIADVKSMTISSCITSITLRNNHLTDDVIRHFTLSSPALQHLDLSHNYISNSGLRHVFGQITASASRLRHIDVSDNLCHAEGGRIISRWLPSCPSLQQLNVGLNQINDDGGCMILTATVNSNISDISLASCGLGQESISVLSTLLLSSLCLFQHVNVSGCDIEDSQQQDLVRALENNSRCVEFHMKSDNLMLQSRIRAVELKNLKLKEEHK